MPQLRLKLDGLPPPPPSRSQEELTEAERAYRRGALQALQFLIEDLYGITTTVITLGIISDWEQALVAARDSRDPKYLGCYLDQVRRDIAEEGVNGDYA